MTLHEDSRNIECKGLKAGMCLVGLKKSNEASVNNEEKSRGEGDDRAN